MAKRICDPICDVELWRVYLSCATACIVMLSQCVLSLSEEGQLLLNWKQDLLEDPDNNLSNWNVSDAAPCFWTGVSCTENSVSALDFSPFWKLGGDINEITFNASLSKYSDSWSPALAVINFQFHVSQVPLCTPRIKVAQSNKLERGKHEFVRTFPRDIVNCSKLVYLDLSWSYITGEVLANILNLQRLQVLDLTYAKFEGTVMSRIGELQELRVLRLAQNHFEGQMSESILSLLKLQELTLSENNWNVTPLLGFFTIPNLRVLWLGSNLDLVDTVPWPNFSLWESNMEDLRLNGVTFPQALFPMTKLKSLHLSRCNILGPIPSLENMTHLEFINLANNTLTGEIPDIFGGMPNLTVLWLFQNPLSGFLPAALSQCKKLRDVNFSRVA